MLNAKGNETMSAKTSSILALLVLGTACGSVEPLMPSDGGTGGSGTGGSGGRSGTGGGGGSSGSGGSGGSTGTGGSGSGGAVTDARPDGEGPLCSHTCDIACPFGFVTDAKGCPTCQCLPPPPCTTSECPPPPPYAYPQCPGGTVTPAACTRSVDNKCSWHPPVCNPPTCGNKIACDLACPNGYQTDANACQLCACKDDGCPSGTHPVSCPLARCAIFCSDGFVRTNGCDTCACRTPATCSPIGVACVACPFGYRKGPNGCATCACEDPPTGCAPNVINAGNGASQ
jgi:hypothetical protein